MFNACNGPYIILRDCIIVFSAGEEWIENPETYESSFYKRTLDNEIYIFTAPSFTSKFSERFIYSMCIFSVHRDLQCGLALSLSSSLPLDVIPTLLAKITLSGLWYHSLYPSPFPAVSFSTHPHPPSCPLYFLLSPLITLTDMRTGKCQCNVAVLQLTGLTHVLASQISLHSYKVQAAKNAWNSPKWMAIILLSTVVHILSKHF